MSKIETEINKFMRELRSNHPYDVEFHQAVDNLVTDIMPWYLDQKRLVEGKLLERVTEPDRQISFRVVWEDDDGHIQVNRGYRIQFNNSLGPYKGGLRFHPTVNPSILKFLGFEQIFKNSLTGLPMGGAKGGANFDPKGKSEREIMRFCQSYMNELYRHIGENIDIPAGDIGVGSKEISFLFGQYKKICNEWRGVLTGKDVLFGGSEARREATGYGCVILSEKAMNYIGEDIESKRAVISGSGNVALYTARKAIEKNVKVLAMSDSSGFIYNKKGISLEQWESLKYLKENKRERIHRMAENFKDIEFFEGKKPWAVEADIVYPCATQNEIEKSDVANMIKNGVKQLCEGANMPLTSDAEKLIRQSNIIYIPGKASNAGGVAVSGFERSQNAIYLDWSKEKVEKKLVETMSQIHSKCAEFGSDKNKIDYVKGANLAGFYKVSQAILSQGF